MWAVSRPIPLPALQLRTANKVKTPYESDCFISQPLQSHFLMKTLSDICFFAGLASVLGSIAIWYLAGGKDATFESRTHGELFGIFVGLWAPTFLILSNRLARYNEEKK